VICISRGWGESKKKKAKLMGDESGRMNEAIWKVDENESGLNLMVAATNSVEKAQEHRVFLFFWKKDKHVQMVLMTATARQ
jgi:hypothetical protein